jgi:hypothetical protein
MRLEPRSVVNDCRWRVNEAPWCVHRVRALMVGLAISAALVTGACSGGGKTASASATLQAAADATAKAQSFTFAVAGAEAVYQAPDRVQQVEHGEATSASGTNGGSASSSGPHRQTITKVFVGDRYYEATTPEGETPAFTSSERCADDQNAAERLLVLLRAIATSTDVQVSGDTYTFHIPDLGENTPTSGTATVASGYVRTLAFTSSTEVVTIDAVNDAPSVTEPASSTAVTMTCG